MTEAEIANMVITAVVGIAGGSGATALINSRLTKRKLDGDLKLAENKQDREQKLAEEQQPVNQLTSMVETLDKTYQRLLSVSEERRDIENLALGKRIDKLETDLTHCLQSHIEEAAKRGRLEGIVEQVSQQLNLNTQQTIQVKEVAIKADTKADSAMDASQTALLNLPPPEPHK